VSCAPCTHADARDHPKNYSSASCVIFISNRIEVPLHQGLTKAALNKQKNIDGRMRLSQSITIINKFARIILY
jgi:hypothetical protein